MLGDTGGDNNFHSIFSLFSHVFVTRHGNNVLKVKNYSNAKEIGAIKPSPGAQG